MRERRMGHLKRISRFACHLTLLVCYLTTSIGISGCRSGGIPVRSWDKAVSFVQAELEKAGDLAGRLEGYAHTAANLSAEIDALDQARPALELIAKLRDVHVPLLGDGWQILLALLSLATVDGAKIIAKLEETLSALAQLKDSLENLTGLPEVADAVRAFGADPNRNTLAALSAISTTATPSMRQVHADLGEILDPLKGIAGNLSGLITGLRAVAGAKVPAVSDVAREAAEGIGQIEGPMLALRDGLDQLHQDMRTDVEVLEKVQEAVQKAREHEE